MRQSRRICFRLTTNRIFGAVCVAISAVNLTVVGVAFGATLPSATLTMTSASTTPPATTTFFVPSSTAVETNVQTLIPSETLTQTPSATPTYTLTFTSTNTATQTPSATPTYTLTSTGTSTSTPSLVPCNPRNFWPRYVVQKDDTLFSLARATNTTVYELRLANCLLDDVIYIGQLLYVPRMPNETPTAAPVGAVSACIQFEDLKTGTGYKVGEIFKTDNTSITVAAFAWSSGILTDSGTAYVAAQEAAGGFENELQVNNVNLNFNFDAASDGLSILFGEYGGNLNININGEFLNFENFADIDGRVIGGVSISVLKGFGDDAGFLQLSGTLKSFALGGQELWIDNVCQQVGGR